mmetsp:Transcript_29889/g.62980  ORF Transcript_29889/g.62980 Transcript_29889/m.62980 type:complete len:236 (-) Transcript_29889:606-1313(-)
MRGRRHSRRPARRRRDDAGDRGCQDRARPRRDALGQAAPLRRHDHAVSRGEDRRARRRAANHRADRLRRLLRPEAGRGRRRHRLRARALRANRRRRGELAIAKGLGAVRARRALQDGGEHRLAALQGHAAAAPPDEAHPIAAAARPRHPRALQDWDPLGLCLRRARRDGLRAPLLPRRRHQRMGQGDRPIHADVLSHTPYARVHPRMRMPAPVRTGACARMSTHKPARTRQDVNT